MRKRRILAMILAAIIFIQSAGFAELSQVSANEIEDVSMVQTDTYSTGADTQSNSENTGTAGVSAADFSWTNPTLSSQEKAELAREDNTSQDEVSGVDATGATTYSSVSTAGKYLRKQMKARAATITIQYNVGNMSSSEIYALLSKLFNKAVEVTTDPQEGDYLMWHLKKMSASAKWTSTSYVIAITYNMTYRTTASQELQVLSKVGSIVASLNLSNCTELEKVKKIHDYLCKNMSYDNSGNPSSKVYTAYGMLINRTAVCQGYAVAFYALCVQADVSVRCIPGYGYGSNGWENHMWNIVQIGSRWYNIDVTWDDLLSTKTDINYTYFLKNNSDFPYHTRDFATFSNWTASQIAAFNTAHPMTSTSYKGTVSTPTLKSVTSTGCTALKLKWSKVNTASGYYIYYATSSNGTYKKVKTVQGGAVTSLTVTGLTSGKTYYFKIQAYSNVMTGVTSKYSAVVSGKALPSTVTLTSLSSAGSKLTPVWKKVTGATGYQISITYTYKGKTYTKKVNIQAGTASTQKKELTGIPVGAVCKVKVRAYTTGSGDAKVYGAYSTTKTVTLR